MPILGILASSTRVAAGDFESIATTSLSSSASSVEFTSIGAGYSHLQLRLTTRNTIGNLGEYSPVQIQFNSDTGTNYSYHYLTGNGSTVGKGAGTSKTIIWSALVGAGNTASAFNAGVIDILDYANTNKYKTVRTLSGIDNNGSGELFYTSGLWMSTSAITSIKLTLPSSGNFTSNSHFALYGIKSA